MASDPKKKFRLMIKLIVLLFMIACAGPFFIKDKKGRPFMTFNKIKIDAYVWYIQLKHFLKLDTIPEAETDKITEESYIPYKDKDYTEMYKYRDKKGVLHFTEQKPKDFQYEVLYMPVSKEPGVVKKKITGLIDTVFGDEKSGQKSSLTRLSDIQKAGNASGENPSKAGDIIAQTKELLKNVAGQYKEAPQTLNDAKALKKQVERVYQERDKMMDDR